MKTAEDGRPQFDGSDADGIQMRPFIYLDHANGMLSQWWDSQPTVYGIHGDDNAAALRDQLIGFSSFVTVKHTHTGKLCGVKPIEADSLEKIIDDLIKTCTPTLAQFKDTPVARIVRRAMALRSAKVVGDGFCG